MELTDRHQQMLLEALLENVHGPKGSLRPHNLPVNFEAEAVFRGIQHMFDGGGGGEDAMVDGYMVCNLAACAIVALEYDKNDRIPMDKLDHDAILVRVIAGLMRSLVLAHNDGRVKFDEHRGDYHLHGLHFPKELYDYLGSWTW